MTAPKGTVVMPNGRMLTCHGNRYPDLFTVAVPRGEYGMTVTSVQSFPEACELLGYAPETVRQAQAESPYVTEDDV